MSTLRLAGGPLRQEILRQFASFVVIGLMATSAHFATLALAVQEGIAGPVTGSAMGFVVGGVVSYALNHHFTFASQRAHVSAVPRFVFVAGIAFLLNCGLMALFVHHLGLNYLLAQVFTTGITLMWTFTGYRLWAFANPRPTPMPADQDNPA